MASTSKPLTTKVESGSPYQLSSEQVLKASKALLTHMAAAKKEESKSNEKKSLIADEEDDETASPIWLTLSTKKHIVDKKRLKPSKIAIPHSLNASENTTICLITADPQRQFKDIVASPAFPAALGARITKVVGIEKIKAKYNQYENQRKLKSEHDIFLADERIVTYLPKYLGKTLYKGTAKRPIPVSLTAAVSRASPRTKGPESVGTPQKVAQEIEKALGGTSVYLSPTASTSIRIGYSNWDSQKLAENIEAAANALIEKHVPQKWRGVKALYVKGESTAALPIWLADELWVDEKDILNDEQAEEVAKANVGKKRKAVEQAEPEATKTERMKTPKKQKILPESNDDTLDKEIALRKEKLKKQKEEAAKDVVDDVSKASKNAKKAKRVST
ncbi:hypothetical protein HYALB_00004568 [Hymenoscyphus albidus]|uniref:Ribosomal protein L1 n=1 Tax=Hymenoscyphus albidus TaxID=595503 RepID=A0A9N9M1T2_9HELO|nr:hypothetical protein HYALB_00004568 [Hymenoscyphus albidus]